MNRLSTKDITGLTLLAAFPVNRGIAARVTPTLQPYARAMWDAFKGRRSVRSLSRAQRGQLKALREVGRQFSTR